MGLTMSMSVVSSSGTFMSMTSSGVVVVGLEGCSLPDTDRPGTPSEDIDVGSCSYKSSQSSPDDESPCDSPAITLSDEEEEKKKEAEMSMLTCGLH